MEFLYLLFIIFPILVVADFFRFLAKGTRFSLSVLIDVFTLVLFPIMYIVILDSSDNDCCDIFSATFSPKHRVTVYFWVIIMVINYFYSANKDEVQSPVIEVVSNSLLIATIVFNIFITIHIHLIGLLGNIPIILIILMQLVKNHRLFLDYHAAMNAEPASHWEQIAIQVLKANIFIKFPTLLLLFIPLLTLVTATLLIFGQKPDSIILAFTDTYKHGLSSLDCKNVDCGGHYLCSVAANGHKNLVKPLRFGVRHGNRIICNRQLLVSNAFEELVFERAPKVHRFIRRKYNRVGDFIHAYYNVFNIKWVSDIVYLAMKPIEFFFLLVLYTFDKRPENRIARQYT